MHVERLKEFVEQAWSWRSPKSAIIQALEHFITIPNDSPAFDSQWREHGFMAQAAKHLAQAVETLKKEWAERYGCRTDDVRCDILGLSPPADAPARTPLIRIEIPAFGADAPAGTVLMYGHLDKQPGLADWSEGLGPRKPVIRGDKLYGRGGADDGYAIFSAFTAVMALRAQQASHARCVIIIEACEDSGSLYLEDYVNELEDFIGPVSLIVCLDAGCADYENFWITSSLRGVVNAWVKVEMLTAGVHSGEATGVVPSCFRIFRQLLSRLECERTGRIVPEALAVPISPDIWRRTAEAAQILGDGAYARFPFVPGAGPAGRDGVELILDRTWRTGMTVTGMQGIPDRRETAGNVMLPWLAAKLSFRLPPTLSAAAAAAFIRSELTREAPYGARVTVSNIETGDGWAAPELPPWLRDANDEAAKFFFGGDENASRGALYLGEGGSIPFMGMLGRKYPEARFLITGVLGPNSNAHGPDEFLHLPAAAKVTMCVSLVLARHAGVER